MKPLFDDAKLANQSAPPTHAVVVQTPDPVFELLKPLDTVSAQALVPVTPHAVAASAKALVVAAPRVTEEQIGQLGEQAASSLSSVSSTLLAHVKTSETGEFGKGLNDLVVLAKGLDPAALQSRGLFGRFKGIVQGAVQHMVAQYSTVERQMDALVVQLDQKAALQSKRIGDMETMYSNNEAYHGQLEDAANKGEQLLAILQKDFEAAQHVAVHDSFGAQRLADHQRIIDRLAKRIDDLRRAMLLAKQAAPQIRLMQENARSLVQKFGDIKTVTLPAWKNTFSLYVLQVEQQQAVKLAEAVDDATEAALRKNADLLRQNTEGIARSRQRAVVTVETLEHVQAQLLGSVEAVKTIEAEGKARREAEKPKLLAMEKALIAAFAPKAHP